MTTTANGIAAFTLLAMRELVFYVLKSIILGYTVLTAMVPLVVATIISFTPRHH